MNKHNHTTKQNKRHTGQNRQRSVENTLSFLLLVAIATMWLSTCKPAHALTNSISDQAMQASEQNNSLTNGEYEGYYKDLSKKLIAVKPYRYTMAFFVRKNWCDPQPIQYNSTKPLILSQDRTIRQNCLKSMVWATPLNKPLGEYAGRLLLVPRVNPNHPMINHSVVLTHKLIGGYHA